ncbi:hypothetical protein FZEAL_10918 [Fusarium zealandicum]|uniref:Uncharacterized protein n=1 Tax=Fusarium zealandicum TaxID=1053134 RepID=A0A8H4TTQ7_9HYPO|nr:hypothetical protein FZEAL_10918 [Fusarium zealandicum]
MPPFAAELEEWWLRNGYEALVDLVDSHDDHISSRQCGFAQHMQRRLLAFDNDRTLQIKLEETWPGIRVSRNVNYQANPRKNLREAALNIFQSSEEGGINFVRVMDGLGYLDAMEIHRLRLMEATRVAVEASCPDDHQFKVLEELHRTTSANYKHFHTGFRTCILIHELTRDNDCRKETPQIMARLNALFPSVVFLGDEYDIDPTPYSPGLRDSIRFSVFEHLMSEDPFSQQRQQVIQMKLLCWCDIPGYSQARDALIRYSQECKKLEGVCLAVLDALERRPLSNVSGRQLSAESSFVSCSNTSSSPQTDTFEGPLSANTPPDSQPSAFWAVSFSTPPVPHPLHRGVPGRELSAAKTDGAGFAGDYSAPPVLCYPHDISRTEFFEHPLARELDMTSMEKSLLGLLIPKELESRDF